MKRFLFLILLIAAFGGAYYAGRARLNLAQQTFIPTRYPPLNRSFVVAIVGRNNGAFLDKTISSVLEQKYENFRIVYVDDGSEDGSLELARDLLFESGLKIELLVNAVRKGSVANLVEIVRDCQADEIVVVLGGEDWLAHEWVLSTLNEYYANPNLWITYGQSCEYPQYAIHPVKTPGRDKSFTPLPLCSFYAGLFREIGDRDLQSDSEMSYMLPMLEMADGHATYVPEVLYVRNGSGDLVDETPIREIAAYEPILKWGQL